jgi:hypothetical protein
MTEPLEEFDLSEAIESAAQMHANNTGAASIIGHIGLKKTGFLGKIEIETFPS